MSTASDIREALTAAAGAVSLAAPALPEPAGVIARITAAALGTAAALIDQGASVEQVIAAMHRARRLDTSVEDAAVDAIVAAKPSSSEALVRAAQTLRAQLGSPLPLGVADAISVLVDHHDPQS